jgi:predicted TIM-barrel fold metal-dependent hydrolase
MSEEPVNRDAWREQVVEAPLEPELPIIDAHHHLWPEAPVPHMEPYGPDALAADKIGAGHNIVSTVFVEAYARYRKAGPRQLQAVGETDYAECVGREADARGGSGAGLCAAIVAHADMMLGAEVDEVLDAHRQASPDRLRGVRYLIAHDHDYPGLPSEPDTLSHPRFQEAFARLGGRNLSFDVWLMHPQLPQLAQLCARFPETTVILDHVGGPMGVGRYAAGGSEAFEEWRQGMRLVARHPNVMLKLGGLNMEYTALGAPITADKPWSSEEMMKKQERHVHTAIDIFGPSRCMFESNFPVDRMSTGYTVLWNAFKRMSASYSAAERTALFSGTAKRVYRLRDRVFSTAGSR